MWSGTNINSVDNSDNHDGDASIAIVMKEVAANKYTKTSHWGNNQENCHRQGLHIWSKYEPSTQQEPLQKTEIPDCRVSILPFSIEFINIKGLRVHITCTNPQSMPSYRIID